MTPSFTVLYRVPSGAASRRRRGTKGGHVRHVMVWFSCSAVGCEAKAERLVDVRLSGGHDTAYLDADQLPEGWWHRSAIGVEATDQQRTFCPEHSPRKAGT